MSSLERCLGTKRQRAAGWIHNASHRVRFLKVKAMLDKLADHARIASHGREVERANSRLRGWLGRNWWGRLLRPLVGPNAVSFGRAGWGASGSSHDGAVKTRPVFPRPR